MQSLCFGWCSTLFTPPSTLIHLGLKCVFSPFKSKEPKANREIESWQMSFPKKIIYATYKSDLKWEGKVKGGIRNCVLKLSKRNNGLNNVDDSSYITTYKLWPGLSILYALDIVNWSYTYLNGWGLGNLRIKHITFTFTFGVVFVVLEPRALSMPGKCLS